jgi:hypothetical protein
MISSALVYIVAANGETDDPKPARLQPSASAGYSDAEKVKLTHCGLPAPCVENVLSASPAIKVANTGGGTALWGVSTTGVGVAGTNNTSGNYAELGRAGDALHAVAWKGRGGYIQAPGDDGIWSESAAKGKSGVYGVNSDVFGYGVAGRNTGSANFGYVGGAATGVYGEGLSMHGIGVWGVTKVNDGTGVAGEAQAAYGTGVSASAHGAHGVGLRAEGGIDGKAAMFRGNVVLTSMKSNATILELGEGLDYAEGFDVSADAGIGPGSVLVIDPKNPGRLTLSSESYDRKVAGIVAGAKGLDSGVRLGVDQYDYPVALAGRVYCSADATFGEISPGDLLTSSPTPGHAMVVKDHTRAQGTILGKAMERLQVGQKGQILVLVTLQ